MPSMTEMQQFLSQRRIGLVGVSRDAKQFANSLFRAMAERGIQVIPINPHAAELEGAPAYPSLQAVPDGVDGVILLLPPAAMAEALDDALAAGVKRIWFRSSHKPGAHPDLVARAKEAGAQVIDGACPYMVLSEAGWFHRFHGTLARLTGEVSR